MHNPDFTLLNGRKMVIEYFADASHIHPPEDEELYIQDYSEVGYKCLVIWSYDLWPENVVEMVTRFLQ